MIKFIILYIKIHLIWELLILIWKFEYIYSIMDNIWSNFFSIKIFLSRNQSICILNIISTGNIFYKTSKSEHFTIKNVTLL